jgi:hypothetical protein
MNFAVIIQNDNIRKWQKDCIDYLNKKKKYNLKLILNCKEKSQRKFKLKNIIYYIINFFCLQNEFTNKKKLILKEKIDFFSVDSKKKNWKSLPKSLIKKIKNKKIDFIIKFGLDLLYIEKYYEDLKIISFHHGNPEIYRGRPAGFYEILNNENHVGVSLQVLNNKLDSGDFLVINKSKIYDYSYKKTTQYFYDISKYVLEKGLDNLKKNKFIKIKKYGKNYTIPSFDLCFKFLSKLFLNKLRRIIYGIFYEKKWNVAKDDNFTKILSENNFIKINNYSKIPKNYHFFADPHVSCLTNDVRVEGIKKYQAKGNLVLLDKNLKFKKTLIENYNHFSYPFSFIENGKEYLMPEVASHSVPYLLNSKNLDKKIYLEFEKDTHLLDATLYKKDGIFYIFGTDKKKDLLYLFHSNNLFKKFYEHVNSPIAFGPYGSRMGGNIFKHKGKLYRFGQNNLEKYGSSIILFEITAISINQYQEKFIKEFKIKNFFGPHTFSINNMNQVYYDFYYEKFNLFSGIRRIMEKL